MSHTPPRIERVERFIVNGNTHETLAAAVSACEDAIERRIHELPGFVDVPRMRRIAFIEALLADRHHIASLLSFEIPEDPVEE